MRPMKIDGIPTRTLRARPDQRAIDIIDQTRLPHALHWVRVATMLALAGGDLAEPDFAAWLRRHATPL